MLIASWNVNSIRSHERVVLDWVEAKQPDALAMQETMCAPSVFPRTGFSKLGYEVQAAGTANTGGGIAVATRSEHTIEDVTHGFVGASEPFHDPRTMAVTVNGIRIWTAYAPNGRKVDTAEHRFKLAWFKVLNANLDADGVPERPLLLVGDLNIAPTDNDVWDAHHYRNRNLTSPGERRAFQELEAIGLVDVIRRDAGTHKLSSWWNRRSDFYDTDRGWRLDHALASTRLAPHITASAIDRSARIQPGPDHAPVLVAIDVDS